MARIICQARKRSLLLASRATRRENGAASARVSKQPAIRAPHRVITPACSAPEKAHHNRTRGTRETCVCTYKCSTSRAFSKVWIALRFHRGFLFFMYPAASECVCVCVYCYSLFFICAPPVERSSPRDSRAFTCKSVHLEILRSERETIGGSNLEARLNTYIYLQDATARKARSDRVVHRTRKNQEAYARRCINLFLVGERSTGDLLFCASYLSRASREARESRYQMYIRLGSLRSISLILTYVYTHVRCTPTTIWSTGSARACTVVSRAAQLKPPAVLSIKAIGRARAFEQ